MFRREYKKFKAEFFHVVNVETGIIVEGGLFQTKEEIEWSAEKSGARFLGDGRICSGGNLYELRPNKDGVLNKKMFLMEYQDEYTVWDDRDEYAFLNGIFPIGPDGKEDLDYFKRLDRPVVAEVNYFDLRQQGYTKWDIFGGDSGIRPIHSGWLFPESPQKEVLTGEMKSHELKTSPNGEYIEVELWDNKTKVHIWNRPKEKTSFYMSCFIQEAGTLSNGVFTVRDPELEEATEKEQEKTTKAKKVQKTQEAKPTPVGETLKGKILEIGEMRKSRKDQDFFTLKIEGYDKNAFIWNKPCTAFSVGSMFQEVGSYFNGGFSVSDMA